ncbi:MAG: hypothetical protein LBQ02_04640 [Candidatus Nomurabacteria bacterium]|jgi:exonuclease VII small subunit|nr:hypothetical protein [Candidatus Nomurabacteria bacterium]
MSEKHAKITINQKMEQLQSEVDWFYSDNFTLDEALERYKGAMMTAEGIEKDLNNIKNDIKVLAKDWTK